MEAQAEAIIMCRPGLCDKGIRWGEGDLEAVG